MDLLGSEDEDDIWFHDSLRRYGQLDMFDVEYSVIQIQQSSPSSLVVLSKKADGPNILSEFRLPLNITNQSHYPSSDYNLKIMSGKFLDSPTFQLVVHKSRKIFASEDSLIRTYRLPDDGGSSIQEEGSLDVKIERPFLALQEDILVVGGKLGASPKVIDANLTGTVLSLDNLQVQDALTPMFLSRNSVGLCGVITGKVIEYDFRNNKPSAIIEGAETARHYFTTSDDGYVVSLSSGGRLRIIDRRKVQSPLFDVKGFLDPDPKPSLHMSMNYKNQLSIGGLDENIYVYDMRKCGVERVFKHEGHVHTENCSKSALTTSHIWYREVDQCVISGADNCSINCWQFYLEH